MKRNTMFLFLFAAAAVLSGMVMPIQDAQGKSVAECKDGQCVISEEDWKRFQEFHRQTLIASQSIDKQTEKMQSDIGQLLGALNRCLSQQQRSL